MPRRGRYANLKTGCTPPDLLALAAEQSRPKAAMEFPAAAAPTVARKLSKPVGSQLETAFLAAWRLVPGRPEPERNYRFHPTRKWEMDFAWPNVEDDPSKGGVYVEIEGGSQGRRVKCQCCNAVVRARKKDRTWGKEIRLGGGHNRGPKFRDDCHKYNAAALGGWTLRRYTGEDLRERPAQVCKEVDQALADARRGTSEEIRLRAALVIIASSLDDRREMAEPGALEQLRKEAMQAARQLGDRTEGWMMKNATGKL